MGYSPHMFGLLIALVAATTAQAACVTYGAGKHELTIGRAEIAKGRHASAYRHFAKGLKLVDETYYESTAQLAHRFNLKDDTIFGLTISRDEYRKGRFREAADGAGEVLNERLWNIERANGCTR